MAGGGADGEPGAAGQGGAAGGGRNAESLREAVETLNQVADGESTPKTIKKNVADLVAELEGGEYSVSVRAANAISALDDITQDPNMPSYVRVTLWQAVSKLEGIRE